MIQTHYLPRYESGSNNPAIVTGYTVWAYIGHPLLGEIKGSQVIVQTKGQAQYVARKIRQQYNVVNK